MSASTAEPIKLILVGASAGGIIAAKNLLLGLKPGFRSALVMVMHRMKNTDSKLDKLLQHYSPLPVSEAEDKMRIMPGGVYIAPANYHLLFENQNHFALSYDEPVNYSRPSIDVSMESAAEVFGRSLLCILLTGANSDGALGIKKAHAYGAQTLIQDPTEADIARMPEAGIKASPNTPILPLPLIIQYINAYDHDPLL